MSKDKLFILIDDDAFNNMLCGHIIKNTVKDAEVHAFTQPESGIDFIKKVATEIPTPAVVMIDINMPLLTGWDVLDRVAALPDLIKSKLRIYMLSSSVDKRDKERACLNPLVLGYIEKPLDPVKVLRTVETTHDRQGARE